MRNRLFFGLGGLTVGMAVVLVGQSALLQKEEGGRMKDEPRQGLSSDSSYIQPPSSFRRTVRPERKTLLRQIVQPGQIQPIEQTPIFARIPGYVSEVLVDMNSQVKKGEVLARLWVPEMENEHRHKKALVVQTRAELEQAREALATAQANLVTVGAQIAEAEAGRKRALANCERWQSELRRMETLVRRKLLDEQTRDETRNELGVAESAREEVEAKIKSARAARDESAARLARARADVTTAEARIEVAQADEQRTRNLLDYREITAPFDGLVTHRHVHTGHLIQAMASSEPLFVVVRTDRVRIFVDVPEADAIFVQPGVPARIRIRASPEREILARVTRISWLLEPANRALRAEIEVETPRGQLRPGMYANATLLIEHEKTWTVPGPAVVFQGDDTYCCQVVEGKVVHLPVHVGVREGGVVELLRKRAGSAGGGEAPWQEISGTEELIAGNPASYANGQPIDQSQ